MLLQNRSQRVLGILAQGKLETFGLFFVFFFGAVDKRLSQVLHRSAGGVVQLFKLGKSLLVKALALEFFFAVLGLFE